MVYKTRRKFRNQTVIDEQYYKLQYLFKYSWTSNYFISSCFSLINILIFRIASNRNYLKYLERIFCIIRRRFFYLSYLNNMRVTLKCINNNHFLLHYLEGLSVANVKTLYRTSSCRNLYYCS